MTIASSGSGGVASQIPLPIQPVPPIELLRFCPKTKTWQRRLSSYARVNIRREVAPGVIYIEASYAQFLWDAAEEEVEEGHCGMDSSSMTSPKFLITAVADADVTVRHSIFSSLHENGGFDDFLAQADSLSAIFAALNDEGEGKEDQAPSFSNCTRTYWTLPMDHYLIDLLLDQVLRGNKIGHAFITQAWNEMVKSFNSKFGSHYDKEVLKSRYKHLREQYNDLKILLDHNGFSWDETQEMVTAEEYVWDSYTKAYPDAQLYKFKTVPSFNKLCVIYGEEGSNGKPSNMAHSEDLDDSDCSRTDWTPSMDRCLIDLLLKQVHKGQIINHIFDEQVWIDIVAAFNDRFGSQHDKYVLKGQYKSLKKLYHNMKDLLELGEFSWDESRQMVTGPDDVWDAYTKVTDGFLPHECNRSNRGVDDIQTISCLMMKLYCKTSNLRWNKLQDVIPPKIGELKSLTHLYLSFNNFKGEIPKELANLPLLRYLYLHENRFIGRIPPELGTLQQLGHLYIDHNQFTGRIPDAFYKHTFLKEIVLEVFDTEFLF
ncbi:unnamed protein product [Camellia sinensis]